MCISLSVSYLPIEQSEWKILAIRIHVFTHFFKNFLFLLALELSSDCCIPF